MLKGTRIVELGNFITAPLTAMMLADLGAEVIKVERPTGDPFRRGHGTNYGPTFLAFNRNKRSIVLDLAKGDDCQTLFTLIDRADILIDNFRPGVLDRLGFGHSVLAKRNPKLINCSITGFGSSGPYRSRPAFDAVGQGLSGVMSLLVDPECPEAFGPTISDNISAMYAATGILAALVERSRTGQGRRVEINMLESSMALIQDSFVNFTRDGVDNDRYIRARRSQCFTLRCADGRLIALQLSTREIFWRNLVTALGNDALGRDERFRTHQLRLANYDELEQALSACFRSRPSADWMKRLSRNDVPYAPVRAIAEVLEDEQVRALNSVWTALHPTEGRVTSIECPVLIDGVRPDSCKAAPPTLGEHTDAILQEIGKRDCGGKG